MGRSILGQQPRKTMHREPEFTWKQQEYQAKESACSGSSFRAWGLKRQFQLAVIMGGGAFP